METSFTLGLAQSLHPDDGDVVALVRRFAERASDAGVRLLVFPESLMSRYEVAVARFAAESQPVGGPFSQAVEAIAAEAGLWMLYTMNERNEGGLPFNTAVLVDETGARRGVYRKAHLFDAQGYRESDRMTAGNALLPPVESPFGRLGVGICYDLRFPELARAAALAGAQVMLYPAAWVAGPRKADQWRSLLAARAIENGMFVAGCGRPDKGYTGVSCVLAPDGELLAAGEGEGHEQLVVARIDLTRVDEVRTATPSLKHRRPDLY